MKRVLLTVHKFFPEHRAGTEVLTLKVGQELQRRGYDVLVATADPPDVDARHSHGADVERFDYEGLPVKVFREPLRLRGYTFFHEFDHPGMAAEFERTLDEFKPDLVHIFHAQNFSGSIIDVSRRRGLPVVCSATDFWFVCPIVQLILPDNTVCRGPDRTARNCVGCYTPKLFPPQSQFEEALLAKYPALRAALRLLPGALSAAARRRLFELYISRKRPAAEAATRARPQALRDAANRTNAIMVPTKLMRDIFIENGINPELLHLVPFGIDTSTLVPFTEKSASQQLRIGYVGSISYHKGVDLLVQAFQSLHAEANAELIIYGDLQQFAEYGAQLQTLAAAKPEVAHKIRFAGTFPNAQFGGVLQNLDVLVVPSRWYENTPLVMQSALATRTPLVVADLGGMSEIVHHETNGLLFAPNDALSLATQLQRLADDRQLLARLRSNIAPERTIAAMVDDIESIYGSARAAAGRDTIGSGSRYAAAAGAAS